MQLKYGKSGTRFAENILGVSEEEQYMRYLQKKYGTEIPEDVETNRPISQALRHPADIGGMDLALMTLSGGRAPFLSSTAAGVETGALVGDAEGEYRKGNMVGAGLMGAAAVLPYGLNRIVRGATRNRTKSTPLPPDLSRRQFVKNVGAGIVGLGVMANTLPLGTLTRKTGKVMGKIDVAPFKKIFPKEALTSSKKDIFGLNKYLQESGAWSMNRAADSTGAVSPGASISLADYKYLQDSGTYYGLDIDDIKPKSIYDDIKNFTAQKENLKNVKAIDSSWNADSSDLIKKGFRKDVMDEAYAMEVMGKEHFSKYGLTPDDINMIDDNSIFRVDTSDTAQGLQKFRDFEEIAEKYEGRTIKIKNTEIDYSNPVLAKYADGDSVTLLEIEGVPVVKYENTGYEGLTAYFVPNEQGLAKLAQ